MKKDGKSDAPGPQREHLQQSRVRQELLFLVEQYPDGGYSARCEGECVFTEADSLEELYRQVRDAVCCHCGEECPQRIRLRFSESGREEVINP